MRARLLVSQGGRNKIGRVMQWPNQRRRPPNLCSKPPGWQDASFAMTHTKPGTAPKREKLSTLVITDDKGDSDSETPPRVNLLQLLNVIHGETPVQKSQMHVHAVVNGVQVKAIVNSGHSQFCGHQKGNQIGIETGR